MKIIACLAGTLDGKIASRHNLKKRFGSEADWQRLLEVRNQADAILCGGETFRQHPMVRMGSRQDHPPLQCILTRRAQFRPDYPLFSSQPVPPITVFSQNLIPPAMRANYPRNVEWLSLEGQDNASDPVALVCRTLKDKGIQTLLIEGGGHVMSLFLQARALDELYLTICPLLLGGKDDPALVYGPGFSVEQAPRTEIMQRRWLEDELYLDLKLHYPEAP